MPIRFARLKVRETENELGSARPRVRETKSELEIGLRVRIRARTFNILMSHKFKWVFHKFNKCPISSEKEVPQIQTVLKP